MSNAPAKQTPLSTPAPGVLHVVATPIGNLQDVSPRALQVLREVDAVCAEDTRRTRQLLAHFAIEQTLVAVHEHNEEAQVGMLVARLGAGHSLALVSDAGTPLISDPGYRLVAAARAAGIRVSPVPGPSALIAALSVSGLASDRFVFEGFLPARASARREHLSGLVSEPRTLIFYESVHRLSAMLTDAAKIFGNERRAVVARELSKLFETVLDGTLAQLSAQVEHDPDQRRGECVVLLAGTSDTQAACLLEGQRLYAKLIQHVSPSTAARLAADISGAPRKKLYAGQ